MLVVFSRQMDAVIASQVQVDRNYGAWRTVSAPGPNDLVWHNIALTSEQRNRKNIRAKLMAFVMVFFFLVPVNLLGAAITDAMAVDGTSFVSQVSVALIFKALTPWACIPPVKARAMPAASCQRESMVLRSPRPSHWIS
jgi:hypothetical protein